MTRFTLSRPQQFGLAAAAILALGAAGGAGAVSLTRPSVEMAPASPTPIGRLSASSGIVTVKGRVAEVFGDRIVLQDATGRTMIDAGPEAQAALTRGAALTVQGRYDDGQFRASYLVDAAGKVIAMGPAGRGPHGPRDPHGAPPPAGGPQDDPPPAGCMPPAGALPPPPIAGAPAPIAAAPIVAPIVAAPAPAAQ